MKNNKKKANKEKRVMAAALCITAVAVAGSTFAWFTSTDEVTNRLSANADYNVSIVESFAPPENWIPGQEVKKDVYATNTGNIGAFVREDISGALTITKEKATSSLTANSIELTQEERYVMEAGSYLAYAPTGSTKTLGDLIVLRPDDKEGSTLTDFAPDVTGLYVFRRNITVAGDTTETFKYEGYYYDANTSKYYKISNLSVTADGVTDKAGDGVKTDGNLANATAGFYEEETEVINPVSLTYAENPTGYTGNYLIASYDTGNSKAEAALANAAAAYDEAIHNLEYLTSLKNAATDEATDAGTGTGALGTANANLTSAQTDLTDALNALQTAQTKLNEAQIAYDDAVANQTYLQNAVNESKTKLYGSSNGSTESYTDNSLYGKLQAATTALGSETQQDHARFENEIDAWFDANKSVESSEAHTLATTGNKTSVDADDLSVAALEEFKTWIVANTASEDHDFFTKTANKAIAQRNYETENDKLNTLDGQLSTANTTVSTTSGALGASADASNSSGSAWAKYNYAKDQVDTKQAAYDLAYANYIDALEASNAAESTKAEIEAAYAAASMAMTNAQTAYNDANTALNTSDGTLKIYIKLSDNVVTTGGTADKWQMLPTTVANDVASFYYTSILDAGETSTRLIESVELDENATQDMYKAFDFDINVALDSVQITFADDNATILADGTPTELGALATLTTATSMDTPITWSKTTT